MSILNKNVNSQKDDILSALKESQEMVEKFINSDSREDIDYDVNFNSISKKNISDRDNAYTKLLDHFVNVTKCRNIIKEIHKWVYFWIIMILTLIFGIAVCSMIKEFDMSKVNSVSNLVALITAIVSFTSVFISIPLIITKYLFSSKEDKRIASIILHTQQHDLDNKKILEKYSETQEENLQQLANMVTKTTQMETQSASNDESVILQNTTEQEN